MGYNYPQSTTASVAAAQAAADAAQADATAALVRVVSVPYTSGLTPSAGWELSADGACMAADSGRLFLDTNTNAAPADWDAITEGNAAKISAGPTTTGGVCSTTHILNSATQASNGPGVMRSVLFQPGMRVAAFLTGDFNAVGNQNYLRISKVTSVGTYTRIGLRYDTGPVYNIESRGAGSLKTAITLGDFTAGVWFLQVVHSDQSVSTYYHLGGAPSDNPDHIQWTYHTTLVTASPPILSTALATINVGQFMENNNVVGPAFSGAMAAFQVAYPVPLLQGNWGAAKRSTSAMAQTLPEVDLGAAAAVYGNTQARAYAARVGNTRAQDGGTLEWRVARGSTGLSGSGSWYAAGSIVVQGTGRYMLIEVRGTSDGLTEYSIRLDIPIAGV